MKDRVRRLLTTALLASAGVLAAGCGITEVFKGDYELEIKPTGSVSSELQSLYVIVSRSEVVAEALSSPSKYEDLASEKLSGNYTSFVVYRPQELSWKQEYVGRTSPHVTHEIDEDSIAVTVDHALLEGAVAQYTLVVLAFYGSDGFEMESVGHDTLEARAHQIIDVDGGTLSLRANG